MPMQLKLAAPVLAGLMVALQQGMHVFPDCSISDEATAAVTNVVGEAFRKAECSFFARASHLNAWAEPPPEASPADRGFRPVHSLQLKMLGMRMTQCCVGAGLD